MGETIRMTSAEAAKLLRELWYKVKVSCYFFGYPLSVQVYGC